MTPVVDETHDPKVKSWVASANRADTDFPIQNLPLGVYRRRGASEEPHEPAKNNAPHICTAIGDSVLDLSDCDREGLLADGAPELSAACRAGTLNPLMALGRPHWSRLRRELHWLLREGADSRIREAAARYLVPQVAAELLLPAAIGDYTDFYASIFHASNVGSMFRPDHPLLPNYKYLPIAYHGRASSIVVSGAAVRRPKGQTRPNAAEPVVFGPSRQLDYELELGFFVGPGNELGTSIALDRAEENIFGLCMVNDWSARDMQTWESQPLGPFLSKNFATTISPWVVTLEALAPFRAAAAARGADDPPLLPYLFSSEDRARGAIDIGLEVLISSEKMRRQQFDPALLSGGHFRDMYWTLAQMLAHHTSNGCNVRPGDLLASGTISGSSADSRGCLLELTRRGTQSIELPTGERRGFLEDGDEIIMRARCEAPGAVAIGFGTCRGIVLRAKD